MPPYGSQQELNLGLSPTWAYFGSDQGSQVLGCSRRQGCLLPIQSMFQCWFFMNLIRLCAHFTEMLSFLLHTNEGTETVQIISVLVTGKSYW